MQPDKTFDRRRFHPDTDRKAIGFLILSMTLAFSMSFGIASSMRVLPHGVHQALAAAPSVPPTAIHLAGCAL
jgi:hypothetical protein